MSGRNLIYININSGNASRYIRPAWFKNGTLSTIAFDLRMGPPPEGYVSHFMTTGIGIECFSSAYKLISKKMAAQVGSIALLDVSEVLTEINDESEPLIKFVEQGLPHCGLIYVTASQSKIQEAKATLCILAKKNMMSTTDIAKALLHK